MNVKASSRRPPTLALILIAGVLVRLVLWSWFQNLPIRIHDEKEYDALAVNLVEYGRFGFTFGEPTSLRPPLYPFVLSALYEVTGVQSYQAVRLFQAAVSLVNALLLYGLGMRLYDRRTALWLTAFYTFYPSLLGMNNLLLTEVQFTFLLTFAIYVIMLAIQSRSIPLLIPAGVLLGLGALTRSVLWLFLPVVTLCVLAVWPTDRSFATRSEAGEDPPDRAGPGWAGPALGRVIAAAALFFAGALTIAPWAVRNTRLEKTFIAVDSMGGRNVMMGNYEYTPIYRSWDAIAIEGEKSWHAVLATGVPDSLRATQGRKDKMALAYGIRYALAHPLKTLQRDLVKFFDFWGLERELVAGARMGYFGPIPWQARAVLTFVIFIAYVLAVFSGLFGMILAPPPDRRIFGLFLLVIGFLSAMHTLSFGHSRYHLPIMPLVLTFSAAAVRHRREVWEARGSKRFILASALCAALLLAWTWNAVFMESDKILKALGG